MITNNCKILIITDTLAKGGKERQIVELIRWLNENTNYRIGVCLRNSCVEYPIESHKKVVLFKPLKRLNFWSFLKYTFFVIS